MALMDEQPQELMDAIIEKCETMDGLGRALMNQNSTLIAVP
ncbi:TPA: hypothetical protein ACN1LF_001756 [Klebsiella pneumoniae]